jgi:hypothetical protein
MAVRKNFIVKNGLEVGDSAVISGSLTVSGMTYPTTDGSNNEVIKTNGSGTLSFGTLRISDLSDVNLDTLQEEGLLIYDSATAQWIAKNELVGTDITSDGGFY